MKNIKLYAKFILTVIGFSVTCVSNADLLHCGVHSIRSIYIQGNRDDNHQHANKVFAHIDGQDCNGTNQLYIDNTDPNSSAILSGLMTAYTAGMRIGVYVNTSKTIPGGVQIAILQLVK